MKIKFKIGDKVILNSKGLEYWSNQVPERVIGTIKAIDVGSWTTFKSKFDIKVFWGQDNEHVYPEDGLMLTENDESASTGLFIGKPTLIQTIESKELNLETKVAIGKKFKKVMKHVYFIEEKVISLKEMINDV